MANFGRWIGEPASRRHVRDRRQLGARTDRALDASAAEREGCGTRVIDAAAAVLGEATARVAGQVTLPILAHKMAASPRLPSSFRFLSW
jgi:hypothetical protein